MDSVSPSLKSELTPRTPRVPHHPPRRGESVMQELVSGTGPFVSTKVTPEPQSTGMH